MRAFKAVVIAPLLVSLWIFEVLSCNYTCPFKPVFTPPTLVVKYGDPASATCEACHSGCMDNNIDFEISSGRKVRVGNKVKWTVDNLTEWKSDAICSYHTTDGDTQCCEDLKVTVYQVPHNVSFNFIKFGPILEGHENILSCQVHGAAPPEKLFVSFYNGQKKLGQQRYNGSSTKEPINESFNLSVTALREDDGGLFWCEAELDLESSRQERPPVVKSGSLTLAVHYGPEVLESINAISITEGETLHLNCSALGNPKPSYSWILPYDDLPHNNSLLTIEAVGQKHRGNYNCTVSNKVKAVSVIFEVDVRVSFTPYIIAAASVGAVILALVIGRVVYGYKLNKMGDYSPKDVLRLRPIRRNNAY